MKKLSVSLLLAMLMIAIAMNASAAVSIMIGTFECSRISLHTSKPFIFGIMTSRMISEISLSA